MLKFPRFAAAILVLVSVSVSAQLTNQAKPLVTQPVNDNRRVALHGMVHPLVRVADDQGSLADDLALNRILMTLRRSDEQETALKQLIDEQQDKNSPNYHQWLTPEQFGTKFGPSDTDIATLTSWLTAHGFNSVSVNKGRTTVEFSGSAGAMRQAFGVSMHRFSYLGKSRTANITDPLIPAALAPLVSGFSSLNNFPRRTFAEKYGIYRRDSQTGKLQQVGGAPQYVISSGSSTYLGVTPYDFATLYNLNPLWNASVNGTGQTIAIVGESKLNPQDFVNFRNLFGLPLGNTSGATGTQYLNIINNGPDPGYQDDEIEGNIDVQWSGAAAPGATIDYVSSLGTETTAGIDLSAEYIIDNNLAPIVSESWGVCEFAAGTSGNSFYRSLWQQAAAQGITVLVAAGDAGSGTCDQNKSYANYGLTVNAIASTPYNTAIGGTDFQTLYGDNGKFGSSNNSTTKASVSAYIPETTWNNTCTNEQLSLSTTYAGLSPEAVCNNSTAQSKGLLTTTGGGGGRSNCISANGSTLSTCQGGYPKPSWQTGTGVPADSVRDIPDVSLFASNGFSRAFYIVCQADQLTDGKQCNISSPYSDLIGVGGTSVGSPAMAGIMALVAQKNGGGRLGNANYNLYALFNKQTTAGTACSASGTPNAACTFNDVIAGTNSVPCVKGSPNCTVNNSADSYGILSGFSSTVGYDLTTGLGSVNASNLANNWSTVTYNSTSTTLSLSPTSIAHGTSVTANVAVSSGTGTPTGDVTINGFTTNFSVGGGTLSSGSYSGTFNNFPGGTYSVKAHYGGDATHAASDSNAVTMTVTPESSKTTLQTLFYNPSNASIGTASSVFYGQYLALIKFTVAGASCSSTTPCDGVPTGTVAVKNNGATYASGNYGLNSEGVAEIQTVDLLPATYSFNGTYSGDASFNTSTSGTSGFTVTKAPTTTTFTTSATTLASGQSATLTVNVPTQSYGSILQTGTISILNGSTVLATVSAKGASSSTTGLNNATATYSLSASQLNAGSNSITVQYSGDGNYLSSTSTATTITLATGGTSSFSLSASPTSLTVSRGSSGTSTISVTAVNGFSSSVALSCSISGSPTGAGCTLSPSSVTPGTPSTLTITTVRGSAQSGAFSQWRPVAFSGITVAGLLLMMVPRRRRFAPLFGVLLLLGVAGAVSGCGGGTSSSSTPGTPTGTYTVTVTGTSGSITQTTSVSLAVN